MNGFLAARVPIDVQRWVQAEARIRGVSVSTLIRNALATYGPRAPLSLQQRIDLAVRLLTDKRATNQKESEGD